jgi:hypothetical protein
MIRKYLFFGLLVALVSIIAWMVIQTRRADRQRAADAVEMVRSVKPTPTRAYAPQDLEVAESSMTLAPPADPASQGLQASHRVAVRNSGPLAYGKLMLSFSYTSETGEVLGEKRYLASGKTALPGETLTLDGILVEAVPRGTVRSSVRIVYAEIERSPSPGEGPK